MRSILEALDQRVLVCDGAMGTMLYSRGVFINRSFDALNLDQPDLVAEVHKEYVRAGADVLETNTFGANRVKLGVFGLADRLHAINAAGARIAREAARDRAWVAGAIGPLGIRIEPWGRTGVDEAEACFREQAAALLDGGVDLFVLETFRDVNEIGAAMAAIRGLCDLPIVAQMTTEEDGNTLDGAPPEQFAPELERRGATVIGVNCSVGPAPMLETIERLARATDRRLSAQPNAGRPRDVEGRTLYLSSPDYMASYARRFIARGVRLVGGCCGTTPEHIRQIKLAVRALAPEVARVAVAPGAPADAVDPPPPPPVPTAGKSALARALAEARSALTVVVKPPLGHDAAGALAFVRRLAAFGVDAVTVPDTPKGAARMSATAMAVLVQQQGGPEAVLQYACRDRYLLNMQSDLLGVHATGVRNLILFTGDPRKRGDYSDATLVFDVDSIGLTNAVSRLNHGRDVGGKAIGVPTAFHVGVIANPTAPNPDDEIRRFDYKVEAGAEYAVTLPIYDLDALDRFLARTSHARLPILAAIRPFESVLHAEYLANEMPNLRVPAALLDRMRRAGSPEAAAEEGLAIATELACAARERVQGLQIGGPPAVVSAMLERLAGAAEGARAGQGAPGAA